MSEVVSEMRPAGRHFGVSWYLKVTDYGDSGEVEFAALRPSVFGGSYAVAFDSDEGVWFPFEFGGSGDDFWDYAVCEEAFESPLEALRAVVLYDLEQRALMEVHEAALRSRPQIGS